MPCSFHDPRLLIGSGYNAGAMARSKTQIIGAMAHLIFALQGGAMPETRRRFVLALAVLVSSLIGMKSPALEQHATGFPHPPKPADPNEQDKNDLSRPKDVATSQQTRLALNEKQFRSDVEKLWQLSGELRAEVQSTATPKVFSVSMFRKTEEIEKLAKQLKGLAKG